VLLLIQVVCKLKADDVFNSVDALKDDVNNVLDDEVEALGYILLGHGSKLKGKQRWLIGDEDLADDVLVVQRKV